jgi:hypothetical protein
MDSEGLHIADLYEWERNISVSIVDIQDTAISLPTVYNNASQFFLQYLYLLEQNYQQYFYCPNHQTPQPRTKNQVGNSKYYTNLAMYLCVLESQQ